MEPNQTKYQTNNFELMNIFLKYYLNYEIVRKQQLNKSVLITKNNNDNKITKNKTKFNE